MHRGFSPEFRRAWVGSTSACADHELRVLAQRNRTAGASMERLRRLSSDATAAATEAACRARNAWARAERRNAVSLATRTLAGTPPVHPRIALVPGAMSLSMQRADEAANEAAPNDRDRAA